MIKNNSGAYIYDVFNTAIIARVQPYSASTEGVMKGVVSLEIEHALTKKIIKM